VAGAIAALDIIARGGDLVEAPLRKARAFTAATGLAEAQSPIVPVILGETTRALEAARMLERAGFLAVAIRPPSVPEGTARLRLTFTALHPDDAILKLAGLVRGLVRP
jgi:8-amino-7-oxononanoate synthase